MQTWPVKGWCKFSPYDGEDLHFFTYSTLHKPESPNRDPFSRCKVPKVSKSQQQVRQLPRICTKGVGVPYSRCRKIEVIIHCHADLLAFNEEELEIDST